MPLSSTMRCRTDVILKAQALIPGAQEQAAGHAIRLQLCRQLTQTLEVHLTSQSIHRSSYERLAPRQASCHTACQHSASIRHCYELDPTAEGLRLPAELREAAYGCMQVSACLCVNVAQHM